ncbi:MAG TPA: energy transducer TonB [Gemmatimonadaceae bacterium]|nr:energy transducer TonB [Gemmatimonadaceae bacterium]
MLARVIVVVIAAVVAGCREGPGRQFAIGGAERPDEPPVMVNAEMPFRYPPTLYARRVQGNVMLRLFVDTDGRVLSDSTRVEESSGYPALDSAAMTGSQELYFIPAKLRGEPLAVSVLFPVYFRHPEAAPLPGDTILARREDSVTLKTNTVAPPAPAGTKRP